MILGSMIFRSTLQTISTLTKMANLLRHFRSKLRNKINVRNVRWRPLKKLKPLLKRKKLMWSLTSRKKIKMLSHRNRKRQLKSPPKIKQKMRKKTLRKKSKRHQNIHNSKNRHQLCLTNHLRKKRKIKMKRKWIVQLWPTRLPETWKNKKNYFSVQTARTTPNLSMITLKWPKNYWPTIKSHQRSSW